MLWDGRAVATHAIVTSAGAQDMLEPLEGRLLLAKFEPFTDTVGEGRKPFPVGVDPGDANPSDQDFFLKVLGTDAAETILVIREGPNFVVVIVEGVVD